MVKKIVSFFASGLLSVSCAAAVVSSDNCNIRSYAASVDTSAYERVMEALERGAEVAADQVKITLNDAGKTYAKVTFTLMNGDEIISSKKLDGSGVGTSTFKNLPMDTSLTLKITVPDGFEVDGKSGTFTVSVSGGNAYTFSIAKVVVPTEPPTTKPAPTQAPTTVPEPTEAPTTKPEPTAAPETKPVPTQAPATEAATEAEAPDTDPSVINTIAESETTTTTAVTGKNLGSDGGKKDTSTSAKKDPTAASATKKEDVKEASSNTGVQAPTVVFGALGGCAVIAAICLLGRKKSDDDDE